MNAKSTIKDILRPSVHRFFRVKNHIAAKRANIQRYDNLRNDRRRALRYFLFDPEADNFTYDIANREELAYFLANEFGSETATISGYIRELDEDTRLAEALTAALRTRGKNFMPFGRRIGWYCIVRITRPRQVVETGVHDGLGSSVVLAALQRNIEEGHPGRLTGIDIAPGTAWIVPEYLRPQFTHIVADSHLALKDIDLASVDLFIHDSAHTYGHEAGEYQIMQNRLAARGLLLSDNSHSCDALKDYAAANGRSFSFWREEPKDHFYPGAGIGVSRLSTAK